MTKIMNCIILIAIISLLSSLRLYAQISTDMSDRYIRVAEAGELVDSVNVWGDVSSAGRYLLPKGTTLPELISFSYGYSQLSGRESSINWAKTQIEVKVSRFEKRNDLVEVAFFRYRYYDPEPSEMFRYELQNNDLVTLQVKRRPSFGDYVGVVAPVVGVIATSLLLIQNLGGN